MTVYNGRIFLSEQINSVLRELLPNDEIIIVNDASTDDSLEYLNSIKSDLVRVYTNNLNIGVLKSFERGLKLASREFIFLCDQDDIWIPGKREEFVKVFELDKSVSVVISDVQVIDANSDEISPSFMATRGGFNGGFMATLWRNRYLGCAMAFRREILAVALPIPGIVPMHDMWFGIIGKLFGKVVYLPRPFLKYRRHANNVSPAKRQTIKQMVKWRLALFCAVVFRIIKVRLNINRN